MLISAADKVYAGGRLLLPLAGIQRLSAGDWVNLNNSYGYVPLEGTSFWQERELRYGAVNNKTVSKSYFKLAIDHGKEPASASYAYALLPGANAEETEEFYSQPTVEILAMTENMHAVRDLETGVIGINAFTAGESLCGMTFLTPCSVMIKGNEIFVSDPTQTQNAVSIAFDFDVTAESDGSISQEGNVVTVIMPIRGKPYSFTADGY